jgi:hypothetical protein
MPDWKAVNLGVRYNEGRLYRLVFKAKYEILLRRRPVHMAVVWQVDSAQIVLQGRVSLYWLEITSLKGFRFLAGLFKASWRVWVYVPVFMPGSINHRTNFLEE